MKNWTDYLAWLNPRYWLQNHDYSRRWDKKLLELLQAHHFERESHYIARLGSYNIWIENHPYASFHPEHIDCRPSRSTIRFARRRLLDDLLIDDDPFPRDAVQELEELYKKPSRKP